VHFCGALALANPLLSKNAKNPKDILDILRLGRAIWQLSYLWLPPPKIYENPSSVYSESFLLTCAYHGCGHPDNGRSGNGFRGGIGASFWARYFKDRP
jgi:hypothetical protein